MTEAALNDTELALHLFARNPEIFDGIELRGDGPIRQAMVEFLQSSVGNIRKIPSNVDNDSLLGGLDLSATLASGQRVDRAGLIEQAEGGVMLVSMAERMDAGVAAHLAQAIDRGAISVILLSNGSEPDDTAPAVLTERVAFRFDVGEMRHFDPGGWPNAIAVAKVEPLIDEHLRSIAVTALALGVGSARALLFAQQVTRAHAALDRRGFVEEADIIAAVRLVLAPRATRIPHVDPPPEADADQSEPSETECDNRQPQDAEIDDILLEAAAAAIPKHVLEAIENSKRGGKGQAGKSGQKQKSALRGRPLSARPGVPGHGRKLALIDSLRVAAPFQAIRRQQARSGDHRKVHIRKSDLRVRAFEQRRESLTIFAVDASGSSALSRLAEAKGAVELMLAEAYVKRSQVALIAFRQSGAEILLPPTRSLTRARRALAALPGGGGTPLAAGLVAAQRLAEAAARNGQTPAIAILTDGKGNVSIEGNANRETAMVEAMHAARSLSTTGFNSIVIDISPRPRAEAAELAEALGGRYLPLPQARSAAMVAAIESL